MQSLQSQNLLKELDWPEVLRHLQNFCTSGTAKIRMSALGPAASAVMAQKLIHHCFDAVEVLRGGSRPFMESLDLFESWFGRLKRNAVLKTLEIKDVRSFCLEVLALEEVLKVSPTPLSLIHI